MKKHFSLSVSGFAIPAPFKGSIDTYSGYFEGEKIGVQFHKEIQSSRKNVYPNYLAEVSIKHKFKHKNFIFEISGRMDGIYQDSNKHIIEEIKSAFNINKLYHYILKHIDDHPFFLQLLTYGYIYWLKTNEIPQLNLHLVSSRNKKSINLPIELNIKKYELWLECRLFDLEKQTTEIQNKIKSRKKIAKSFTFPFIKPRHEQNELMESLKKSFLKNQPTLIQAPTGLGKTMGVLYPALQEAMSRGQKVIYVTPKNSQHTIAQQAIKKIQENHLVRSMTVTAKSKLCFKSQSICNSEFCEYAKDYYTKITENHVLSKLKKFKNLTASQFKQFGLNYEICPFELQMDHIQNIDAIICDYNYVFSPQGGSNRVGKIFLGEKDKPNLVIDEFHNLPSRGMSYYSPSLSALTFKNWILSINEIDLRFREKTQNLLVEASKIVENSSASYLTPHKIIPPSLSFKEMEVKLRDFLTEYLESDVVIEKNDIILNLCREWIDFTSVLEYVGTHDAFFVSYHPKHYTIKVTCCDPSQLMQKAFQYYQQIVGFSATLKPFRYYSELSGLDHNNLATIEFSSPFPKSQRKLLIIPQVSSIYKDRLYHYPRIAEIIHKIIHLKKGNYFVFFPSFDFLENVLRIYKASNEFKLISQRRNMNFEEVQNLLSILTHSEDNHLIFAVQGGILSEGVDYPGKMMIGAMIVGVPLPVFDWEREQMKLYYENQYQAGLDYAYIVPAMAKAIQSAGRVIRSENDKGIIVLMDHRFLQENYFNAMPVDWFEKSSSELVSTTILADINNFWNNECL